jgi:hypothetical protein
MVKRQWATGGGGPISSALGHNQIIHFGWNGSQMTEREVARRPVCTRLRSCNYILWTAQDDQIHVVSLHGSQVGQSAGCKSRPHHRSDPTESTESSLSGGTRSGDFKLYWIHYIHAHSLKSFHVSSMNSASPSLSDFSQSFPLTSQQRSHFRLPQVSSE